MIKFDLTEKEEQSINIWIEEQKKKKEKVTTIGGRFTYCFSPNSVGMGVTVIDNLLGDKLDATDYDCW